MNQPRSVLIVNYTVFALAFPTEKPPNVRRDLYDRLSLLPSFTTRDNSFKIKKKTLLLLGFECYHFSGKCSKLTRLLSIRQSKCLDT